MRSRAEEIRQSTFSCSSRSEASNNLAGVCDRTPRAQFSAKNALNHRKSHINVGSLIVIAGPHNVKELLAEAIDFDYIRNWAPQLGVTTLLNELMP
jgi:hypothetical protein